MILCNDISQFMKSCDPGCVWVVPCKAQKQGTQEDGVCAKLCSPACLEVIWSHSLYVVVDDKEEHNDKGDGEEQVQPWRNLEEEKINSLCEFMLQKGPPAPALWNIQKICIHLCMLF